MFALQMNQHALLTRKDCACVWSRRLINISIGVGQVRVRIRAWVRVHLIAGHKCRSMHVATIARPRDCSNVQSTPSQAHSLSVCNLYSPKYEACCTHVHQ